MKKAPKTALGSASTISILAFSAPEVIGYISLMAAVVRRACAAMFGLVACGGRVDSGGTKPNGEPRPAGSTGTPAATAEGTGASLAAVAPAGGFSAASGEPEGAPPPAGAAGGIGGRPVFTGCDPPCPSDQYCDYGREACVCSGGFLSRLCDGACVDTSSDPDHCGACHLVCDAGTACLAASCMTLEQLFSNAPVDSDSVYIGYSIEELWDPEAAAALPEPPDDEFVPAHDYEPSGITLEFGDGGATVEVPAFENGTIPGTQGTLVESSPERRLYVLDNHWAGGTLKLRIDDGRVVVELTVFGTSLPVMYAHRGTLVVMPL